VLDGTLIPIDQLAADRPFYSGKHRKHGMNLQVIATPSGEIAWVSGALPGSVHDLTAARIWGVLRALEIVGQLVLAGKGYNGAGEPLLTSYRAAASPSISRTPTGPTLDFGPGELANAQLKAWRILCKLRCCPHRASHLVKAIHVLQKRETHAN
jgi:hypothetical protein